MKDKRCRYLSDTFSILLISTKTEALKSKGLKKEKVDSSTAANGRRPGEPGRGDVSEGEMFALARIGIDWEMFAHEPLGIECAILG